MSGLTIDEAKKDLAGILQKAKETQMTDDQKKSALDEQVKAEETRKQAEIQAKKDEEILSKKDDALDEAGKKRKAELLEQKVKDDEAKLSADEKIKKVKDEAQKRIDTIVNELKEVRDKSSKQAESLQKELEVLRQEKEELAKKITTSLPGKDDIATIIQQREQERLTKYLVEDAEKPREQRREISDEELDEWFLEDAKSAQVWITERTLRRAAEKNNDLQSENRSKFMNDLNQKQGESNARVLIRHPELDTSKREAELKSQGKTDEEINTILCQENEKYRIAGEIVKSDPSKYLTQSNGPELVMKEMEKRLSSQPSKEPESQSKIDELTAKVEALTAEIQRLQNSDEGINSTVNRSKEREKSLSEREKLLVDTMKSAKAPQEKIDAALKKFREKQAPSA